MALSCVLPAEPVGNGFIGVLLWQWAKIKAKCYAAAWILPGTLPPAASRRVNLLELRRWGGWSFLWCARINFRVLFSHSALSPFQKESSSTRAAAYCNCAQLSGLVFLQAQDCRQCFHFEKNRGASISERPWHRLPSSTLCGDDPALLGKKKSTNASWILGLLCAFQFWFLPLRLSQVSSWVGLFLQKEKASGMTVKTRQSFACRKMSDVAATHSLNAMWNAS